MVPTTVPYMTGGVPPPPSSSSVASSNDVVGGVTSTMGATSTSVWPAPSTSIWFDATSSTPPIVEPTSTGDAQSVNGGARRDSVDGLLYLIGCIVGSVYMLVMGIL